MMIFTDEPEREFRTIKSKIGIKSSCFCHLHMDFRIGCRHNPWIFIYLIKSFTYYIVVPQSSLISDFQEFGSSTKTKNMKKKTENKK